MTRFPLRSLAPVLLLAALAACEDDSPGPPPAPDYLGAEVSPNPTMVVAAVVTVEAERYDSAWVRVLDPVDDATARTPAAAFAPGGTSVRIPVLGLAPEYQFVCGMCLGYEDATAPENKLVSERERCDAFAEFRGF